MEFPRARRRAGLGGGVHIERAPGEMIRIGTAGVGEREGLISRNCRIV